MVDRSALNQLSRDELVALLLAQEARIAELEVEVAELKKSESMVSAATVSR